MAQQTVVVDITLLGKMAGYIEMLVKDPYSTIFAALSDIYRAFGLHDEAVSVAQRGTEMVPSYAPGFVALGRALAEKGDPQGASSAYRQALSLDASHLPALTGLASSSLACGQSEEALALLTRAQSIDPLDEVVLQLFPVVKKLVASVVPPLPPTPPSAALPPVQTAPLPKEVVSEEPVEPVAAPAPLPPIATATLADIYIKQGFPERAIKVFSDLLAEDPDNIEIRQRYNDLVLQIKEESQTETTTPVAAAVVETAPIKNAAVLPRAQGKEALIALYGRWLDAINRRRADVC